MHFTLPINPTLVKYLRERLGPNTHGIVPQVGQLRLDPVFLINIGLGWKRQGVKNAPACQIVVLMTTKAVFLVMCDPSMNEL